MIRPVDYDTVALPYDKRYEANRYDGVEAALERFVAVPGCTVGDVGCGTGHWLAALAGRIRWAAGVDLSEEMLQRARASAPSALLVCGRAEQLPWVSERVDRLFCINALHHFRDPDAFIAEARRVISPGGALLTIGLDPHTSLDRWWIYDYFPAALETDRARYLPTAAIRSRLEAVGFVQVATEVAQHMPAAVPFEIAETRGLVDRRSTSQLMVMSEAEYEDGLRRLRTERPVLRADLRLYATTGFLPTKEQAEG